MFCVNSELLAMFLIYIHLIEPANFAVQIFCIVLFHLLFAYLSIMETCILKFSIIIRDMLISLCRSIIFGVLYIEAMLLGIHKFRIFISFW